MAKDLISVVVPVYNGERFINGAIDSILQQDYQPLELIIVDDGSTDGTADIISARSETIQYIRQENSGPAAARNTGIQHARGDYLAFLDVDDLWPVQTLQKQAAVLMKADSFEVVLGLTQCVLLASPETPTERQVDRGEPFFTFLFGAGLFKKSVFRKAGLLDESLRYSEDVDWYLRAKEAAVDITVRKDVALIYRIHGNNMVMEKELRNRGLLLSLKKAIERKKRMHG